MSHSRNASRLPGEASYERGWSVDPVLVSCSLSTRMRISIAALDLGRRH